MRELGPDARGLEQATFYFGKGCENCHHTGYRGRTGIFEILKVDESVRRAVLSTSSTQELRQVGLAAGMTTLRQSGVRALAEGRTTVEEVLRETTL
jgi:type II secretory ATPase GspE/PulE/Tfp pilus assembly ATPase PilB-like protein